MKPDSHRLRMRGAGDIFDSSPSRRDRECGCCKSCDEWDSELDKFGYCRRQGCRADRLVADLKRNKARMQPDGTLIWIVD